MITLALLLLGAALAWALARALGLPVIPPLLIAGFMLSPWLSGAQVQDTVALGAAFLLFAAGLELDPSRVKDRRIAALVVGSVQFAVLGGVALAVALALGLERTEAMYVGMAIAASSTLVVVRLLKTRGHMFEPFGRLVVGVLLLQDILVILLIPVITRAPEGVAAVLTGSAGTLGLVALAYLVSRWLGPWLFVRLALDGESMILAALALLFGFIGLAHLLDLPLVAGAFLAGVALARYPVNGVVRGLLGPLSDFFLALFFTALGAAFIVPSLDSLIIALILAAVVLLVTPPLIALLAERCGLSARASIEAGLLLAQTSELSLVVALQGFGRGHLSQELLSVIVLVTLVTMVITPLVATDRVAWALMALHPSRHRRARSLAARDHVLLLGCGSIGGPILERLRATNERVVVVDDDPAVAARLEQDGVEVVCGDGSDPAVLERVGAREAKLIISSMRRGQDSLAVLRELGSGAGEVPLVVHTLDSEQAASIRELGGIAIASSEIAAERLREWVDRLSG